jgi:hypothetical protein
LPAKPQRMYLLSIIGSIRPGGGYYEVTSESQESLFYCDHLEAFVQGRWRLPGLGA